MSERLELAGRALQRPLCNHCLGRLFASVSRGLSNEQRGFMVRSSILGAPHAPEDISDCSICRGLFGEIDKFAELCVKESAGFEFSTFLVGTKIDAEIVENEESFWTEVGAKETESIKAELNREVGKVLERKLAKTADFGNPEAVFLIDTRFDKVVMEITPLFIYGRYRKHSRALPQTRWPCRECRGKGCPRCGGKGRMYDSSVQDLTGPVIMKHADGVEDFFHGMGREDIDARMLGNGRPFVLEVREPRKRRVDLSGLQSEINEKGKERVEVEGLRFSSREEVRQIKEAAPDKEYRVRVRLESKVNKERLDEVVQSFKRIRITQQTPTRVSHRRADLAREREIKDLVLEELDDQIATLRVRTESGTYVKELVHGDSGRTVPSLAGKLGIACTVEELDVIEIADQT